MSRHERLPPILHDSTLAWTKTHYYTALVMAGITQEKNDESGRHLALITAATEGAWQAAEVRLEDGRVVTINDLRKNLPPDDKEWSWKRP